MMTEWVAVGGQFIAADVIRWKEGVFERRGHRGRRVVKVGEWVLTAEVLKEADRAGWVHLLVRRCEVRESKLLMRDVIPVKAGTEIRRAYKTIVRGKPERLLWSEESVRAQLARKFKWNKAHDRFMAMETDED